MSNCINKLLGLLIKLYFDLLILIDGARDIEKELLVLGVNFILLSVWNGSILLEDLDVLSEIKVFMFKFAFVV